MVKCPQQGCDVYFCGCHRPLLQRDATLHVPFASVTDPAPSKDRFETAQEGIIVFLNQYETRLSHVWIEYLMKIGRIKVDDALQFVAKGEDEP